MNVLPRFKKRSVEIFFTLVLLDRDHVTFMKFLSFFCKVFSRQRDYDRN